MKTGTKDPFLAGTHLTTRRPNPYLDARRRENVAIGIEHLMRQEGTAIFIAVSIVGNNEMSLPMIMNTPVALCVVLFFVAVARRTGWHAPDAKATI